MFKIASLLAAAVVLFACEKVEADQTLRLTADKDVIQSDGNDVVTFKVMEGDKDVTSEAFIYDEDGNEITGAVFSATEDGEYGFWALYGSKKTLDKSRDDNNLYVVKAISVAVPEAVADPQPGKKSFVHRAFLTQYTGVECPNCPLMIRLIKALIADKTIPTKAVHAAVHSFKSNDPAYIVWPKTTSYPYLTVDGIQGYKAALSSQPEDIASLVEASIAEEAKAGISVNPVYYEDKGMLVVKVSVKAAVDGLFNVGAWLLEDGVYGAQSDSFGIADDSYSVHENCVRVSDSKFYHNGMWTIFGHELGTIKSGDVATKTFVMNVKRSWNEDNLHLAVFASYGEANGKKVTYSVCNAVDVPIDAPTPFEYK